MKRRTFMQLLTVAPLMFNPCKHRAWCHDRQACRGCGVTRYELEMRQYNELLRRSSEPRLSGRWNPYISEQDRKKYFARWSRA